MTSWLGLLLLVLPLCLARPKECDPIFGDCEPSEPVCEDDIFGCTEETTKPACEDDIFGCPNTYPEDCFESLNEIEDAIFAGDTRQAFNDCDKKNKCSVYADAGYACAPSWTCHNNTIITDGKGLIDVRQSDASCAMRRGTIDVSDTKCDKVDHVCCKKPNQIEPCTIKRNKKEMTLPEFGDCGRTGSGYIVTGEERSDGKTSAQPGEFPHMCAVYRVDTGGQREYIAGASLIARNKVLTVAHKIHVIKKGEDVDLRDDADKFAVRCGEHNIKNEEELLDSQVSGVAKIIFHPQYNPQNVKNNLVILITKENFVYQQHIGPVCLPAPNQNFDDQTECFSSGWGKDDLTSVIKYSDSLKKVQMPVVSTAECEKKLRSHKRLRNKPNFKVDPSWVCIGGEAGSDTCTGDGGSPHVCKNQDGKWVQVGAVAWGLGCGDAVPAVYSSVPSAMCWIDWVMSCQSLSLVDIDLTTAEDLDLRQVDTMVNSVNRLTTSDCGDWLEKNGDLTARCEVKYQDIDERG